PRQTAGAGARAIRHQRELGRARLHGDEPGLRTAVGELFARAPRGVGARHCNAPDGHARGHRLRGDVPRLRLRILYHRAGVAGDRLTLGLVEENAMNEAAGNLEPWQWPEEHWRGVVNHVRAGRTLRPAQWKDGARCAVALSFDSDHETNELREGGKSFGRMSWGQYGPRQGVPRILEILKRHAVPATFYVPAVAALLHPDEQRRVIAEGHEIGIHSWIHELNSVLSYDAERDIMLRSTEALEKITGVRPVGARTASWDFSPHTLRITKEMGLLYDSSLM